MVPLSNTDLVTFLNTLNADHLVPNEKVGELVSTLEKLHTPASATEEKEQLKLIAEELAKGSITLADVDEDEQMLLALESVHRLSQKLRVLRTMCSFRERFEEALAQVEQLQLACDNVRHSFEETHTLERTICLVLTLSNYFISQRKGSCVYGFRVSTFKTLAESKITKWDDKSCTLMGFIAQLIEEKEELRSLAKLPEELNLIQATEKRVPYYCLLYYILVLLYRPGNQIMKLNIKHICDIY